MNQNKNKNILTLVLLLAGILLLTGFQSVFAQGLGGELKWLRIGELQGLYSEQCTEVEDAGPEVCNWGLLSWPAQYSLWQYTTRARAFWIGSKNFYDTKINGTLTTKVVGIGPRQDNDQVNQVFEVEHKLVGKYEHPLVVVDAQIATVNTNYDALDEIDESMPCDRMLVTKVNTALGVTVTRKVMAFAQSNHDNYFIYDYVIKNTGIVDRAGTVYEQTLQDLYFWLNWRYALSGESVRSFTDGWGTWDAMWGRNTVNQVIGQDPNAADFEMRALYAWYGLDSARPVSDDWGCPNEGEDGVLAAAKYAGVVMLHADTSPDNQADDVYQPVTTWYLNSDDPITQGPYSQYDEIFMGQRYEHMSSGHPDLTHAEEVGDGFADTWGNVAGESQGQGFGPYTLEPGDSIHLVMAEGVSGISREKNREVGYNWLLWENGTDQPELVRPDGSTTTDHNLYKKEWVQSCEDSLIKTFRNALANYESGYDIPASPPPPDQFTVASGGDRVRLSWTDNAVSSPNFDGYVIYRSQGTVLNRETRYTKIFECNAANVVHTYDDTSARRGFDYYYYIQTKDNGSTNDLEPGKPLTSSLFWTVTSVPANLLRPAGKKLEEVVVVPNPYDIRARAVQFGDDSQYDRLVFYGLPPFCKLQIYTERGDLIWEKIHDNGAGDEFWDSFTSSGQIVVSGLYILYVEVTEDYPDPESGEMLFTKGESTFRKFIVIR